MKKRSVTVLISLCLLFSGLNNVSAQSLAATATVYVSGQTVWDYTLTNLESATSNNWLTDFYLPINAPITDIQTSNGWQIDSDNSTFIHWSNIEALPYPDDIAPGSSAFGFSFNSVSTGSLVQYTLSSWDHGVDAAGPYTTGSVLAPSVPAAVPEASTGVIFVLGFLFLIGAAYQKMRWRKTC